MKREDYLHHERIDLFGCSRGDAIVTHPPLADHLCDLYAGQDDARTAEILEPCHRFHDAFDGTVILLDDVVQVFAGS